jgi:hypothetical protein
LKGTGSTSWLKSRSRRKLSSKIQGRTFLFNKTKRGLKPPFGIFVKCIAASAVADNAINFQIYLS